LCGNDTDVVSSLRRAQHERGTHDGNALAEAEPQKGCFVAARLDQVAEGYDG
jgi:hypothetical protein